MSNNEIRKSAKAAKSWRKHYEAGQAFYESKDAIYMKICDHHRAETEGNFQSLVYNNIRLVNGILYFAFHTGANNAHELTDDELGSILWQKTIASISSPKNRKGNSHDFYPEADTLGKLFIETFCARYDFDQSDEELMKKIRRRYLCYLANQMNGVIAEKRTYVNLVKALGEDRVRWAEASEEKTDVDLYVDDLPVSVKNYYGFTTKYFRKYREAKGCTKPVLYMNEELRTAIPVAGDRGGWRYEFHAADELNCVIESIGGKPVEFSPAPKVDRFDDADIDNWDLDLDADLPF